MTLLDFLTFLKNNFSSFNNINILKIEDNKIKFSYNIMYYLNDTDFYILKDYLNYLIEKCIIQNQSATLFLKERGEE